MQFLVVLATTLAALAAAQSAQSGPNMRPFASKPTTARPDNDNNAHAPNPPHLPPAYHIHQPRSDDVVPGVYVCKGPGWTNSCNWQRAIPNTCMALPISDTLAVGVS